MQEAKPKGMGMPVEIERKFLEMRDGWRRPEPSQPSYLCKGEVTVRLRRAGSRGILTKKGRARPLVGPNSSTRSRSRRRQVGPGRLSCPEARAERTLIGCTVLRRSQ